MTNFMINVGTGAFVLIAAAAIAATGCAAQSPATAVGIDQQIRNAISREDHEAVASQYERQASVDAASAKRHVGYAATYRKNRSQESGVQVHEAMAQHCENLAQTYEKAAGENLALAKLHRALAVKPK